MKTPEEEIRDYIAGNVIAELRDCPDPIDDLLNYSTQLDYDLKQKPGVFDLRASDIDLRAGDKTYIVSITVVSTPTKPVWDPAAGRTPPAAGSGSTL